MAGVGGGGRHGGSALALARPSPGAAAPRRRRAVRARGAGRMKTPVTLAPEDLDFTRLVREGDTIGWAEATAEPVFLTRILNAQAPRCPPFGVFFALGFATEFAAGHPNVTVSAF